MRRGESPFQHTAIYAFLALTGAILLVFVIMINGILLRIGSESATAKAMIANWLVLKSNVLAHALSPYLLTPASLQEQLAACDKGFNEVGENPLLGAMRKIDGTRNQEIKLPDRWDRLHLLIAEVISLSESSLSASSLSSLLDSANEFEISIKDRVDLIDGYEKGQRTALTILQQISLLMITILIGYGIWISSKARRSAKDETRLHELISATYSAQEAERKRVALDLHDSIAQEISVSLMIARRLEENERGDRVSLIDGLKGSIDSIRRISWGMSPPELERLGFQGAASGLIENFEKRQPAAVLLDVPDWNFVGLKDETELHLYRILQEALNNIEKHARANHVHIAIHQHADLLSLRIADDGNGFDAPTFIRSAKTASHLGLAGMRERARLIGAKVNISSVLGNGTTITLEVPYGVRE